MRNSAILSGVALSALLLATAPAAAVSLTIGGDSGLVSVSPSTSGSGSTTGGVSVDVGGTNGLLDLNGNRDTAVEVDLGGAADADLLDLDTGGDDGVIVDLFGPSGAVADVQLGLDDGVGSNGLVDLDTGGDDGVTAELFGPKGAVADIDLGLGGDNEVLDVNGDGGAAANVNLVGRSAAAAGADGTTAAIDLFGPGNADGTGGSAGEGTDDTATGSISSPGDGSDDGTGAAPAAPGNGVNQPVRPAPAVGGPGSLHIATATTGAAACFSPDQGQIAHLLARNAGSIAITAQLGEAENVKLVPINLCEDARAQLDAALAADANVGLLQSAIAADAEISAALEPSYQPDDVLAADQSGEDLTVYVY